MIKITKPAKFKVAGQDIYASRITATGEEVSLPTSVHHVLLADRSGSMWNSARQMAENIKSFIKSVRPTDIVSVVYFSSAHEVGVVVNAKKAADVNVEDLNVLARTLSTTCFSEAYKKLHKLDLSQEAIYISLFTDGQPVVSWSQQEEVQRCIDEIKKLASAGKNIAGCFTIGYGSYYNPDQMRLISAVTDAGHFYHVDEIHQLNDTLTTIRNYAENGSVNRVDVGVVEQVLSVESGVISLSFNSHVSVSGTHYLIDSNKKAFDDYEIDDEHTIDKDNFLYAYASGLFYNQDQRRALEVVAVNIKDRGVTDLMVNAFTRSEKAQVQTELDGMALNTVARMQHGKCPPNYIPPRDATTVFDILTALEDSEEVSYLWAVTPYQVTRRSQEDQVKVFTPVSKEDSVLVPTPITLVIPEDRLNLSIRFTIPGTISLNKMSARRVGLPDTIEGFVYRTHTIVLDGNLHVPVIRIIGNPEVAQKLHDMKVKFKKVENFEHVYDILLHKHPVVNAKLAEEAQDIDKIAKLAESRLSLSALAKAAGYVADEHKEKASFSKVGHLKKYSAEQLEVLKDHGVRPDGSYSPYSTVNYTEQDDYYEYRELSFTLSGFSSLPSLNDIKKKIDAKKPFTPREKLLADAMDTVSSEINSSKNKIVASRDVLKKYQSMNRSIISQLAQSKIATVLSGSFWTGLKLDAKDSEKYNYEFVGADQSARTLNIATRYQKQYLTGGGLPE